MQKYSENKIKKMPRKINFNNSNVKTVFIATLLKYFIIVHTLYEGTAVMAIDSTAGVLPRGIDMAVGGNLNITCILPKGSDYKTVWFYEKNFNQTYKHENDGMIIVNDTALLKLENLTANKYEYVCKGENLISTTTVNVDSKPDYVKDFFCRGYDFEYFTCNFTKPRNFINTSYKVTFTYDNKTEYPCEDLKIEGNKIFCNLTNQANSLYVKGKKDYYFIITGENIAGKTTQIVYVNNFNNVVPAKINIKCNPLIDSVELSWAKYISYYLDKPMIYEFGLQPQDLDDYQVVNYNSSTAVCNLSTCKAKINNLNYAYYNYSLSARVKIVPTSLIWSETVSTTFRTKPKKPGRPPSTTINSFHIDSEMKLHLYWQELPIYDHSGSDFHYIVTQTDIAGIIINTKSTKDSTIEFEWDKEEDRIYQIRSCNQMGTSTEYSVIYVSRNMRDRKDYMAKHISKVYNNRSYLLSWEPPNYYERLSNYTIFWCESKTETVNQCNGSIYFKFIDKERTNFTTEPQDKTLNLAVSANYDDYNIGMQWPSCTTDESVDLIKIVPETYFTNSTAIGLKWNTGRICSSIITSFDFTICQISRNYSQDSTEPTICSYEPKIVIKGDMSTFLFKDLQPYSIYRINIRMNSKKKVGPLNDDFFVETQEAAPTPPRDLQINSKSITSKSVNVSWLPPLTLNGRLRFYTIYIKKSDSIIDTKNVIVSENNVKRDQRFNYTIDSLNSYTYYELYVTASTNETSEYSERQYFRTLIGAPTSPTNVTANEWNEYGYINWTAPDLPSGRLEFYVVALVTTIGSDVFEETTIVRGNSCKFRFPKCRHFNMAMNLKVRAVNVAKANETDYETFPKDIVSSNSNDFNTLLSSNGTFECLDAVSNTNFFDQKDFDKLTFIASSYKSANEKFNFNCEWDKAFLAYSGAFLVMIIFIVFAFFTILKKCKRMKNIQAVLPPGLSDHYGKTKPSDGVIFDIEHKKEISTSNDCLIFQKEKLRLLATIRQNSITAGESETTNSENSNVIQNLNLNRFSNYVSHSNESSYEEQFSSESTDSVDINDGNSVAYFANQYGNDTINEIKENLNSNTIQSAIVQNNDLKTIPVSNGYTVFAPPTMTNSGYIEADRFTQNKPTITETESKARPISVEAPAGNYINASTFNNNNNTSMYVTQAQLAELGRCLK